jgi:predicted phosphodiesterase
MMQSAIILPDTHTPFEDKRKLDLFFKVLDFVRPGLLIVLGDFFDFYQVSFHDKSPERRKRLKDDIDYGKAKLAQMRKYVGKAYFIEGNHEHRLTRYIWRNAPELGGFECLHVPYILGMKELDYHFTGYRQWLQIGKMNFTHDVGDGGAYAHYKAQQAFDGNVVIGHTHRMGLTVVGNARGKPNVASMFGWMGDADAIDYEHKIKVLRNSVHGFGYGFHDTDTGYWQLFPVPVINNSVVIEGRLIKG